jgi:hypothetical protein
MPTHTFVLNGTRVSVDCSDDLRLLWVLRDLLGITGPKYGCGLDVCKACTCHINGKAFNPCAVPVSGASPGLWWLSVMGPQRSGSARHRGPPSLPISPPNERPCGKATRLVP